MVDPQLRRDPVKVRQYAARNPGGNMAWHNVKPWSLGEFTQQHFDAATQHQDADFWRLHLYGA